MLLLKAARSSCARYAAVNKVKEANQKKIKKLLSIIKEMGDALKHRGVSSLMVDKMVEGFIKSNEVKIAYDKIDNGEEEPVEMID